MADKTLKDKLIGNYDYGWLCTVRYVCYAHALRYRCQQSTGNVSTSGAAFHAQNTR